MLKGMLELIGNYVPGTTKRKVHSFKSMPATEGLTTLPSKGCVSELNAERSVKLKTLGSQTEIANECD